MSYSSSCRHHLHHPQLQQNWLTQVHLEKKVVKMEREEQEWICNSSDCSAWRATSIRRGLLLVRWDNGVDRVGGVA